MKLITNAATLSCLTFASASYSGDNTATITSLTTTLSSSPYSRAELRTSQTVQPNRVCHMIVHGNASLMKPQTPVKKDNTRSPYEGFVPYNILFQPSELNDPQIRNDYEIDLESFLSKTKIEIISKEKWYALKQDYTSYDPLIDNHQYYYQYLWAEFPGYFGRSKL